MTFRAKLQQAILGVVAGTTVAVLFVAQSQNSASYRAMVDTLFRQQMETFRQEQDMQLAIAKKQAERLARSPRLFAALEEGDSETYNVAVDELRLAEFDFFRLASSQVETGLMPPPENSRTGVLTAAQETALSRQLNEVARSISEEETEAQVGFAILPEGDATTPHLYRVLAMQIRNFDQTVGMLFLGQSVRHLAPVADPAKASVRSAFWTQGQVVGEAIPASWQSAITARASKLGPQPQAEFSITVADVEHRVDLHLLNPASKFEPTWLVSVFSLADLQAQQRRLLWRVIGIGSLALLLASLAGRALAAQLTRPIDGLVSATREVKAGNLAVRLDPGQTDEFNTLNTSFNEMTAGLALKERYHSVLSMVADAKVAEQLIAGNIQLGGELRRVTVIFCDIRGYTAMSAGRDPREVIALLNNHMGALTRVVYRWHGVINQFAGDAIMILFGAPASHGRDAENAVNCALEMIAERHRLNRDSPEPLGIGIGIATGDVVAGCIGAENRADYTVVGEHVNLAARLCSSASAGEIVMDATTRGSIPATFRTLPLESLKLKGFSEPIPAFRITSSFPL